MKALIVFVAVVASSAAFLDLSAIPDRVFQHALEGFQYPYSSPDPCINATLTSCQNIFNKNLNISSNADWTDPFEFARQLFDVLKQGVNNGLVPVCNAWQQFYSCLGSTYYSCFNPIYLISQGIGLRNAFGFTAEILRTQFKCVGGFEQSIKKYSCIINAIQSQDAQDQCFGPFNQTLSSNNFDQICQAVQNMTTCYMNIFAPCGNDAQWWICEDLRVGFALFNCPNLRCNVPPPSGQLRVDHQEEVEDNEEITEEKLKETYAGVADRFMMARNAMPHGGDL